MKDKIILIGGGGHCKSCIDVIEAENSYEIVGIVDVKDKIGGHVLGYSVIASDNELEKLSTEYRNFLITIGQVETPEIRIKLYRKLKSLKVILPTIISPQAYVSKHTVIGEGTIVMHQALVNINASVGVNCIINSKALIEHDAVVGDHCHISTGAIINGGAKIGQGSFFGSNATSKHYAIAESNSYIKANSIVK